MINEKKMQLIKVTEQYLLEKHGAAFLKLSKEKQNALICETIRTALENKKARV
jgi:hypothetical protein